MIQFCTGIPGSGKTYYGIFNIAIHFAKDLKDNKKFKSFALSETKYKSCLTNINELKFDEFENVKELDFNKFKTILTRLHNLYKLGLSDTEIEDSIKDEDFFYTLIVLDECQNFLNKDDEVLVWWLSYHRHFFQDIILLTQDIPLVHKKYKSFTEFYYKAMPSSRKLFNTSMVYHQYSGYQLFQTQKVNTKKLPILNEIFSLYGSGENNKQKSLVVHFLVIAFVLLIILIVFFFWFISTMTEDEPKKQSNQANTISNPTNYVSAPVPIKKVDEFEKSTYFEMFCNKNICFVNNNVFNREYIFKVLNQEYKTRFIKTTNNKFYFLTTDKFNLFEKKESINEKDSLNNGFNFDMFKSQSEPTNNTSSNGTSNTQTSTTSNPTNKTPTR